MDEPRLGGPIPATSIELSTRFSNRYATRLQLGGGGRGKGEGGGKKVVPRSKYHSCVTAPYIAIDLWNSKYGSCSLWTYWGRAPSAFLYRALVPCSRICQSLPSRRWASVRGGGALARPVVYRKLSSAMYARRLTTLAEMRNVTGTFGLYSCHIHTMARCKYRKWWVRERNCM